MSEHNTIIYTTSDIALAAYLKLKGLKLINYSRGNRFNFVFEDPNSKAEQFTLDFINSDMRKYDDEMRSLRKYNPSDNVINEHNIIIYTTSNIALAAYLKLKSLKLINCDCGNKFNFIFENPNNKAEQFALDFINSDIKKYNDEMRSLKKIIYSKK